MNGYILASDQSISDPLYGHISLVKTTNLLFSETTWYDYFTDEGSQLVKPAYNDQISVIWDMPFWLPPVTTPDGRVDKQLLPFRAVYLDYDLYQYVSGEDEDEYVSTSAIDGQRLYLIVDIRAVGNRTLQYPIKIDAVVSTYHVTEPFDAVDGGW